MSNFINLGLKLTIFGCTSCQGDFMPKGAKVLGVYLLPEDKERLQRLAQTNQLTMSDLSRLLILEGMNHFGERELLRSSA